MDTILPSAPLSSAEVEALRDTFPFLRLRREDGRSVIYLDNAATSQKPQAMLDALATHYATQNANVHRGVHYLSELATTRYQEARQTAARFLGSESSDEIVFTRSATEGVNLVAQAFLRPRLRPGDVVVVTEMEHHSNIVPWWLVCRDTGATLRPVRVDDNGELDLADLEAAMEPRTCFVAIAHVSNVLGTVNPVDRAIATAHARGIPVLLDGAQAAPRLPVNVSALCPDFYVCSGHKMLGPTGIGVLYGRREHLAAMPPWQGGGGMVEAVSFDSIDFAPPPARFEAGTPHIAGAVGLAAAMDYLAAVGLGRIAATESRLADQAVAVISRVPGTRIIGAPQHRAGVVSFVMDGIHPHDVAQVLDGFGIAVRAGHHCAQPLMTRFGVTATVRVSPAFYNTADEIEALEPALREVRRLFG